MIYDIIVVGAGPAGLTAGANAANRGLTTLILEGLSFPGGQPAQFYPKKVILDHPGFPKGVSGKELSKRLFEQALNSKAEIKLNEPMIDMKLKQKIKTIITANRKYKSRKIILATGLHNIPRHLECLKNYTGNNVHYFIQQRRIFKNKHILVIGGGDTAFDRANMVAPMAKTTTIILREHMTKAKVSSLDLAKKNDIIVLLRTELIRLNKLTKRAVISTKGEKSTIKADEVIVSIGFVSSLDVLKKAGLQKDRHGMIKTNERMETSIPGVFAAGDLIGDVKLIAIACAEGITAAISTFNSVKKPYWLGK